tara:strand:- start:195 stop:1190 length:996 start_codon:yes stop_codon:yes gene_type:complete
MARHLAIGNAVAVSYSSGVLAAGAVDIQKLSDSGPTPMLPGDTIADSSQFRIVQGDGTTNIVSPWVYGKDVINWSGKSYVAPASQSSTITVSAAATNTADIEVTFKLVNTTNGQSDPFDAKSYTVITNAASINTQAEIGDNFTGAMNADYSISGSAALSATQTDELPWFVKTVTWDGSTVITLVGWDKGETMQNGQVAEYATSFKIVQENGDAAANGGTYTVATGTLASAGYGGGFYVKQMEENNRGTQYGYYNRVQQPITPTQTAVTGDSYDMYHIAATKDGSSSSQIHGVDNIIELNIAFDNGTAALTSALEGVLNPYLASAGFGNINL